jgi:hypothetical protein
MDRERLSSNRAEGAKSSAASAGKPLDETWHDPTKDRRIAGRGVRPTPMAEGVTMTVCWFPRRTNGQGFLQDTAQLGETIA